MITADRSNISSRTPNSQKRVETKKVPPKTTNITIANKRSSISDISKQKMRKTNSIKVSSNDDSISFMNKSDISTKPAV